MKKPRWVLIAILFGTALFLGYAIFTALSVAFYPQITNITKPVLCDGNQTVNVTRTNYRPGETYFNVTVACDGKNITPQAVMLTGLIASFVFFIILLIAARNYLLADPAAPAPLAAAGIPNKEKGKTPLERMTELKAMRDQNLISQAEYERKKDDIMKEL